MVKAEITEVKNQKQISKVVSLANIIWREYYTPIIGKAQVNYMLDKYQSGQPITNQIKQRFLYYLIKDGNGDYVGYIGIVPEDKELLLSKLYILSEKRGKGYGRQAVKFIEKVAKSKGLVKIVLTVNKNNTGSIKAYLKLGFENMGPIVTDIGNGFIMDDYKLEKTVKGL